MGTILFEMLTGVLPFAGNNYAEYLSAMLTEDPRAPQSLCAGFPIEAEPVVRKTLARNPDQRFASATEILGALAALPNYDAQQERLTLFASTVEVRGFAAGDLGQALSVPGGSAGDKDGRRLAMGCHPRAAEDSRRVKRRDLLRHLTEHGCLVFWGRFLPG
jgi:serine/threonine protein kinase